MVPQRWGQAPFFLAPVPVRGMGKATGDRHRSEAEPVPCATESPVAFSCAEQGQHWSCQESERPGAYTLEDRSEELECLLLALHDTGRQENEQLLF